MKISTEYHRTIREMEDERLHIVASQKNPEEFEILYNKYYELIFRFVYQRLDLKESACDISQQVFMKALANIKKYKFKGVPFSAWLYRIAINELNTFFKKHKKSRTINIDTSTIEAFSYEIDDVSKEDWHSQLIKQISKLSPDELTIIEMRYFENRAFKEIGEILSISENNAKVKVYRIIKKLKKQFRVN